MLGSSLSVLDCFTEPLTLVGDSASASLGSFMLTDLTPAVGPQSLRAIPNGFPAQQQLPQNRSVSSRLPPSGKMRTKPPFDELSASMEGGGC
jgi:hypothetical protein